MSKANPSSPDWAAIPAIVQKQGTFVIDLLAFDAAQAALTDWQTFQAARISAGNQHAVAVFSNVQATMWGSKLIFTWSGPVWSDLVNAAIAGAQ